MGFTGGTGHVWKTTNAGATWTDFTANLPDSPVNAVVVYPGLSRVYVGTDVGVFTSSRSSANWTEIGPSLPNVAVTALGVFAYGGQQLLRASTYGRGVWQFNLGTTPDFQISISNSPQTTSVGETATFDGSVSALDGYSNSVTLTCTTSPPSTCTPSPSSLTPGISTPFTVAAGGVVGDYYFNVQGTGSDSNHKTHTAAVVLHVLSNGPDFALSEPTPFPTVNAGSSTTSGPISVTATNGFSGVITLTCSLVSGSGSCSVNPSTVTSIPTTANVTVNATNLTIGSYELVVQGTSGSTTHTLQIPFNVGDYQLSGPSSLILWPGGQGTANFSITPSTYYAGKVNAACDASSLPGTTCALSPANPIAVNTGTVVPLVATITAPGNAAPGTYNINVNTQDTSGVPSHNLQLALTVQDFSVSSATSSQTVPAGQTTGAYSLTIQPVGASFGSAVTLSCPSGLPAGAQCLFNPSTPITPGNTAASVAMTISTSASTTAGTYRVTVTGTSGSLSRSVPVPVSLIVTSNVAGTDFQLAVTKPFPAGVDAGSASTAKVSVTPNYTGSVNASCDASAISGQCQITPANPVAISAAAPVTLTVSLNVPNSIAPAQYNINLTVADASGQPNHSLQLPLKVIPDFSVSSATPSETVTPGQTTGAYQLTIAPNPQGSSFTGAVTLSCPSGLPAGAQCLFSPSTPQTPGNTSVNVVMTISTTAAAANSRWPSSHHSVFYAVWLLLPGIVLSWGTLSCRSRKRKACLFGSIAVVLLLMGSLLSCAGVSSGGGGGSGGNNPIVYPITVTGTSGPLSHSIGVNLVVE